MFTANLQIRSLTGRTGNVTCISIVVNIPSIGPCSSPGWGHCVGFLGKTLYSHGASLHPDVYMCTGELNTGGGGGGGAILRWTSIPSREE